MVVFGASNFPLAFSVVGGDTASALASGNPVIVKAHPAHPGTSEIVAEAIAKAVKEAGLPDGTFSLLHDSGFEVGQWLVTHPLTKAVGFTGSFIGGKALFDLAQQREEPIPVGAGQFCTNPGPLIVLDRPETKPFLTSLAQTIKESVPQTMLTTGIAKNYSKKGAYLIEKFQLNLFSEASGGGNTTGRPMIATTTGDEFEVHPAMAEEVFGPFSLVILCNDLNQMHNIARLLKGQLTASIMGTEQDLDQSNTLFSHSLTVLAV